MRTKYFIALLCSFALFGCATLQQALTPIRVKAIAKLAAYTACAFETKANPIDRTRWVQAAGGLKVIIDNQTWDAAVLAAALQNAGVSEMIGSEGQVTIAGGIALIDTFTGVLSQVKTVEMIRAVAEGMYEGIDLALNSTVPTAKASVFSAIKAEAEATRPKR